MGERYVEGKRRRRKNITFARGGAHLRIAHAIRLPETEIISWGGGEFGSKKEGDDLLFYERFQKYAFAIM